jgi:glucose-6-phosphate dehydrogenase assembly protein OpcA
VADVTGEGLVSAEGAVLTDPGQVERALTWLWEPTTGAERTGEQRRVATRVCVGNLVAIGRSDAWSMLSSVLGEISPVYPTRTIVVVVGAEAGRSVEVNASVSGLCHVPQSGRPQVCSEQIVLRMSSLPGEDLTRTLLPMLEADLPLSLWWTVDPSGHEETLYELQMLANRLVLDAGRAGFDYLESIGGCAARELGWYRSAGVREQVAQMFDGCGLDVTRSIRRMTLSVSGEEDERIQALWVAAFVGGQLGWQPESNPAQGRWTLQGPAGKVEVSLETRSQAEHQGLLSLRVESGTSVFRMDRCATCGEAFLIGVSDDRACTLPRCVQTVPTSRPEALAAALRGRGSDPSFDRAAALARWMVRHP